MKRFGMVLVTVLFFGVSFFWSENIFAQNMSSTNFQVENPHFILEGGAASSTNFLYFSGTGELATGENSSTNFKDRAGFFYFPIASAPVLTATPGDAQVGLSWTPATGILANVTSYGVGMSTTSDGEYVYTSVGDTTTWTSTGLSNGFTYYFKIRSYASGIIVSESSAVSGQPTATSSGSGGGGGGGGGGASSSTANTKVVAFGKAYPSSRITLLKDGQVVASTIAGSDANFSVEITGMSPGSYTIGAYATDANGIRSILQTFPVTVTEGVTVNVGSIFIAPTITADKTQVKQGDNITFFGQTAPKSQVTISVHSAQEIFKQVTTDADGVYLKSFDSSQLEMGGHAAKSKVAVANQISSYGNIYNFTVGTENILSSDKKCPTKADVNNDCRVNLVDFSIAAFWYRKALNASAVTFEKSVLSGDGKIDLTDFSIMAFHWTG